MRIKEFSVSNYRSITRAYRLAVSDYCVLVGPNNEGKSNILRSMVLGLGILTKGRAVGRIGPRSTRLSYRPVSQRFDYDWHRDFPLSLQGDNTGGSTRLSFTFELEGSEPAEFKAEVGSNLATDLRVRLDLLPDSFVFDVILQGPAKKILRGKQPAIASFISRRLLVQYVPAHRSTELAEQIVGEMLGYELEGLTKSPEYADLLNRLDELQSPLMDRLSRDLSATMAEFLPGLKSVQIVPATTRPRTFGALGRRCEVWIDDGELTALEHKGDGIKSLAALALVRHVTQESLAGRSLVLAVEEPESHLHPAAIHKLREVLQQIARENQVVISTHSPVLVDRVAVGSNIIVDSGRARRAQKLKQIRESLGVVVSDSLVGAYLVLLLEGTSDVRILRKLLSGQSRKIRGHLASGTFSMQGLGGASKLFFHASLLRGLLCNAFAFLDSDQEGRSAAKRALEGGHLKDSEYILCTCPGMRESELEDLISPSVYSDDVSAVFGVHLNERTMDSTGAKWSDRIEREFRRQGKLWDSAIRDRVKTMVADGVESAGWDSLNKHRLSILETLIERLEKVLEANTQ